MVRIKKSGAAGFCLLTVVLLTTAALFFTRSGVSDAFPQAVSVWVIGTGSALILIGFKSAIKDNMQCAILYLAYLVRIACMLVDIYGREYVTILHSGADTEGFYQGAVELYRGNADAWYLTRYPPIISRIFRVTGDNRVCAQYINIVFWVLSCFILIRLCRHFKVEEKAKRWLWLLWGFLPTGIFLTSILVRESMEMFFGLWSFERFIYWMKGGKKKHLIEAFLYVIPSIILHTGSIALWATYVVVLMFWDTKRQGYRWQMKSAIVFAGALAGLVIVMVTPLRAWLFTYFGGELSIYAITHRPYVVGSSDYLVNMDCQSWIQFAPYTVVRIIYFLFSPLPVEARGVFDLIAFLTDGFVLCICIMYMLWKMKKIPSVRAYTSVSLLGMIMFAGIFAWGTRNAGTALRHRYLVWGVVIAGLCISNGVRKSISKKIFADY